MSTTTVVSTQEQWRCHLPGWYEPSLYEFEPSVESSQSELDAAAGSKAPLLGFPLGATERASTAPALVLGAAPDGGVIAAAGSVAPQN